MMSMFKIMDVRNKASQVRLELLLVVVVLVGMADDTEEVVGVAMAMGGAGWVAVMRERKVMMRIIRKDILVEGSKFE